MKTLLSVIVAGVVATQATAHTAHNKRPKVEAAMQENGCRMTPELADKVLKTLEIGPQTAIKMFGEMIEEGIAAFADDDETLLLLPPACKA